MSAKFVIQALRDPQVLPRMLDFFAQQGSVPDRVVAHAAEAHAIEIEVSGLEIRCLNVIANKMRNSPVVTSVELSNVGDMNGANKVTGQ